MKGNTNPIFQSSLELTQSQLLLWLGQRMNLDNPIYNMALSFELKGTIEKEHFQAAFQTLVNKSDTLRTVFDIKADKPIQKVLESLVYEVEMIELPNKAAYDKWAKARTKKIFDLKQCLFDCVLVQVTDGHLMWYFNQHHLTTDASSTALIYKKVGEYYQLSLEGRLSTVNSLISYSDYITYERKSRLSDVNEKAKAYWRDKLSSCPPLPLLYHKKVTNQTSKSIRISLDLGAERSQKLRDLAGEKGIRSWTQHLSLYNIFATTLFAFLYKVSGQHQLVIGSPAHNRPTSDFKETIGIFIETFPLFAGIDTKESFFSLLKKIQRESNGFLRNAQSGVASSDLSRSFNVFFNYITAQFPDFNGIVTNPEWIHPDHCDPRHHLRLQVHDFDKSGNIQLYFDLNEGVFGETKRATVPKHFLTILDAFITNKEQIIDTISITTPEEYQATIIDFNKNKYESTERRNIIELIEIQAVKTPANISIVFKEETLSYQQMNEKANQLAHYLTTQGIGLNTQVAICLKRSPAYIISVLAIMKTGATYIPIPSNYPNERVYYLLADSQASLLISHSKLTTCMDLSKINTVNIDTFQTTLSQFSTNNLGKKIPVDSIAFLIYTSGSTGNPKGVMIPNDALTSYIKWTEKAYVITPAPAIPLFTTVGFDITANSVFLPLICGGAIHVYQEGNDNIDLAITEVLADNKVDFVKLTPAHLNFLKGQKFPDSRIGVMSVTGDEFKTELGQHIYEAFDGKLLMYDEYGPSEATIGCIYHQFTPKITSPTVPIGQPIHNMNAYILDENRNPVPPGIIGELYLGGVSLAAGYWNRPAMTEEKFIANPFVAHSKMYQTGDLARINDQGIIEFLGRIDFQVKINGHRIELGEIEARIIEYTGITGVIVTVTETKEGLKNLVAYFTSTSVIMLSNLQAYLAQKLPRYMVPTHYRSLDVFPLSPNGKVDRKALKGLETFVIDSSTEYIAPKTEIEELVAEIWQEVMEIPKIGIHDNFLNLGGDSLRAIRIIARINETLDLDIALNQIFEWPTIGELANHITAVITELLEAELDSGS